MANDNPNDQNTDEEKTDKDIFVCFYNKASDEINNHIKLRDAALNISIVIMGVLIGVAIGEKYIVALLLVPFISIGLTILVAQHDLHIITLVNYISFEIDKHEHHRLDKYWIKPWEKSDQLEGFYTLHENIKFFSQLFILLVPSIIVLTILRNPIFNNTDDIHTSDSLPIYVELDAVWYLALAATVIIGLVICGTHIYRMFFQRKKHSDGHHYE